jgi:HAD superfamily hydrolase (TIGR01549 family)
LPNHLHINQPRLNQQIDGIIFDLDGTLVDSSLNFTLMRQHLGCPLGEDILQFIASMADPLQRQQAADLIIEHEMNDAEISRWLPGAQQLINLLHQHKIPQAIVTRNSADATRIKVNNNQIPIEIISTRENHRPKPAPDALLAIAQSWKIAPQRLMYVGDYLYDVQAGNNAGMFSCLITHGKIVDYSHQADYVYSQIDQLTAALFTV